MKLYVIRHGQTDWNVAGKCQGMTDIELNSTGIKQAEQARNEITNYKIDLIICSPLKRARKTAEIINEVTNCKIISDERIIERCVGKIEGTTKEKWNSIIGDDVDIVNNYNLNYDKQYIEPIQTVLLVTHGGTCRAINAYFNGIGEDGHVESAKIKNCEIREYEFKN